MKIGIIGTRGIPNNYGGYEQFAEILSTGLCKKGHEVTVYNSHNHSFQESKFDDVDIRHCYDPEYIVGTFGQFIYDFNCIRDSRSQKFDIIFQLGYTSSSIWSWLFPKNAIIVSSPDGLEYKRSKYNKAVQHFLRHAERWMIKYSDIIISDSPAIKEYVYKKFKKESTFIPYGANVFSSPDENVLKEFDLSPYDYDMLVARMEPENNIETIIKGYLDSSSNRKLLVVGNYGRAYGQKLFDKYNGGRIRFTGGIYDLNKLDNIRHFSNIYFHGHSVGGTNPSLLEAMASSALICAHDNVFNKAVLDSDAWYFSDPEDVSKIASDIEKSKAESSIFTNNHEKIRKIYTWNTIVDQVEDLLIKALKK